MNHSNPLEHNLVAFSTFLGAAITPPIPRTSHHSKLKHCLSPHPTPVTLCVHLLTVQGPPEITLSGTRYIALIAGPQALPWHRAGAQSEPAERC